MTKITLKFINHYGSYMVGEIASFPAGIAASLIDKGFAVEYGSGKEKSAERLASISSEVTTPEPPVKNEPQTPVSAPAINRPTPTEPGPDPRVKNIPAAPRTKHIPGPARTKSETGKKKKSTKKK